MDKDIKEIVELLSQTNRLFVAAVKNVLIEMISDSKASKNGKNQKENY